MFEQPFIPWNGEWSSPLLVGTPSKFCASSSQEINHGWQIASCVGANSSTAICHLWRVHSTAWHALGYFPVPRRLHESFDAAEFLQFGEIHVGFEFVWNRTIECTCIAVSLMSWQSLVLCLRISTSLAHKHTLYCIDNGIDLTLEFPSLFFLQRLSVQSRATQKT